MPPRPPAWTPTRGSSCEDQILAPSGRFVDSSVRPRQSTNRPVLVRWITYPAMLARLPQLSGQGSSKSPCFSGFEPRSWHYKVPVGTTRFASSKSLPPFGLCPQAAALSSCGSRASLDFHGPVCGPPHDGRLLETLSFTRVSPNPALAISMT